MMTSRSAHAKRRRSCEEPSHLSRKASRVSSRVVHVVDMGAEQSAQARKSRPADFEIKAIVCNGGHSPAVTINSVRRAASEKTNGLSLPEYVVIGVGSLASMGTLQSTIVSWLDSECANARAEQHRLYLDDSSEQSGERKIIARLGVFSWRFEKKSAASLFLFDFTKGERSQPATFFVMPGEGFTLEIGLEMEPWRSDTLEDPSVGLTASAPSKGGGMPGFPNPFARLGSMIAGCACVRAPRVGRPVVVH